MSATPAEKVAVDNTTVDSDGSNVQSSLQGQRPAIPVADALGLFAAVYALTPSVILNDSQI